MDKEILVPLDGSELAEVVLPYAEELAVKLGTGIKLLRVVTLNMYNVYTESIEVAYSLEQTVASESSASLYLEKVRDRLKEKGIAVTLDLKRSTAAEGIIDCAAEDEISLVVMATHGHSGVTRWVLGSVANRVIKVIEKPIMLVRAKERHRTAPEQGILKRIVVPLDGSRESEAVIPHVAWLASGLGAEVVLFQVLAGSYHTITTKGYEYTIDREQQIASAEIPAEDYLERIGKQLNENGMTLGLEVKPGNAAEEIIDFANGIGADMIAMSINKRSSVGHWVFGSVGEKVLHRGNKPLLLVKAPGAETK
ncbi:MAG: universal stress protein [Dehalococcoidales bacterium]|nr:MAG: universal stress protein [Dehalococcoidales bacterium]